MQFCNLFKVNRDELEREERLAEEYVRFHSLPKAEECVDLKMWVHVDSIHSNNPMQVQVWEKSEHSVCKHCSMFMVNLLHTHSR